MSSTFPAPPDSSASAPGMPVDGAAPRWVRGVYVANLVAQTAIVVTGGVVRLTGSGLGCPTWPQCVEGSYTPTSRQEQEWHKYVEFGNRLLTFALGALAVAAIVAALLDTRRRRSAGLPPRPALFLLAAVPLLGTVGQAVLGGITVLTGLNPAFVAAHFLLSCALIAATVVLVRRAAEPGDTPVRPTVPPAVRTLSRVLLAVSVVMLVLGTVVTGSGPHSGDVNAEHRFGFDPRTVSWLHADSVLLFLGLTVGMIVVLRVASPSTRYAQRRSWHLLGIALLQGAIGYVQYFTGLPWVAVALHMLGATLVWIAVVRLHLALRERGPLLDPTPASMR